MQQQPDTEVSQGAAWQAARGRAIRTTDALIVAEARVIDLEARVRDLEAERAMQEREYGRLKDLMERRTSTLLRRAEAAERGSDGYEGDKEQPDTDSVSEAVHTHAFSD